MLGDVAQLEQHRAALTGHCYRMLGSATEADDAVQEAMVRAWRSFERFDGRSSLRTWLYRIATNVCLDVLSDDARRVRPLDEGSAGSIDDALETRAREHWLEPIADAKVIPAGIDAAERALLRESIRLAFVAALQHLPPKQRAALLLTEVLGWSAAEVAVALDSSTASINSAIQRARATLASRNIDLSRGELSAQQALLVERYVHAFERYDAEALAALLREDATLSMPPHTLWLRGRETIQRWWMGPGSACRGSRLVPVAASGSPAFAQYRAREGGGRVAWALVVLELTNDAIAGITSFLDVKSLFPLFDLPLELAEEPLRSASSWSTPPPARW